MKFNHPLHISSRLGRLALALAATALAGQLAHATPYASGITNNAGNISFVLNEGGGNVTVTYDDGTTNANYNGVTTGTNLASGIYSFALGAHSTYAIMVYKLGAGTPTLINSSLAFTPRGVDVNRNANSPYFGRVYAAVFGGGLYVMNADLSLAFPSVKSAGVSWVGNGFSPYRLSVADDDYVMVGDSSYSGSGAGNGNEAVWRIDPNADTNQVFLGPVGFTNGLNAGVHSTIASRPVLLGNPQTGNAVLLDVDGDWTAGNGRNSLLIYSNITVTSLPWTNPPDVQGPEIGLNLDSHLLGGNPYPGLQVGPNGYIYAGTYRENYSNPLLQIYQYDPLSGSINQIWNSFYNNGSADYFRTTVGGLTHGTVDIAVSPDGRYVAGVSIDNWFVIIPLTNGIPDVGNLFTTTPTSFSGNAREIAFDAADNLVLSSSGLGQIQTWTLGITTTATTTGNASGVTGFNVVFPSTKVNVSAVQNLASQGGSNGTIGTPVPGMFTITRTNANQDYSAPITVNFTLGGTASNGVYTVGGAAATNGSIYSVVLPAGASSANITITPDTANIPRLTTTVLLSVKGGPAYSVAQPSSDIVYIQNTSSNQLVVATAAATMYKAFSNDFASVTITRLGDTNAAAYSSAAFTYSGSAVAGTDFAPAQPVTFNPGDITQVATVSPLANGQLPVHTANPTYVGDKTINLTLGAGPGYIISGANTATLTLIDNADPAATVLFADPLTSASDAGNWAITYGNGDMADYGSDYNVEFGYDLTSNNPESSNNGLIGLPPSGATNALRITCNKNSPITFSGGVNVYYKGQAFSGNYAVRFNMNLIEGASPTFAVEGVMFGINHNGLETNWWTAYNGVTNSWASDGVWYWVQAPPGGSGGFGFSEFDEFTGLGGTLPNTGWEQPAVAGALPKVFKSQVFTAPGGISGGTPANNSPFSLAPADDSWSDVEIKQVNNVVTLSIDKTPLFVYTNTTHFTNGYVMLGYDCPEAGAFNQFIGTPDAAAYFSNLRVVRLGPPSISGITVVPVAGTQNVTVTFTSIDANDNAGSFALQGAVNVAGPYADVAGATIVQIYNNSGTATFQATTTSSNPVEFYRIRHK
jgi:hypothetical protein